MSLEALNHIKPRGLLSFQLKVLGLLDHLSCTLKKNLSSVIHFTYFCGLGYHPQVNIHICETLGIGVIHLLWTWGMFWMLLSGAVGNEFWVGIVHTEHRNSLDDPCATDLLQVGIFDSEIENVQIQRAGFEGRSTLWLTPSLAKHPFIISSVTASNKNKCSVIYAVSFSPGAVPWYRI